MREPLQQVDIPPVASRGQDEGVTLPRAAALATHIAAIAYGLWYLMATIPWESLTPQSNGVLIAALFTLLSLGVYPNVWQPFVPVVLAVGIFLWTGATFMLPHSQFAGTPAWQAITLGYILVGLNADRIFQHRKWNWLSRASGIPAAVLALLVTWLGFDNLAEGPRTAVFAAYVHFLLSVGLEVHWLDQRKREPGDSVP